MFLLELRVLQQLSQDKADTELFQIYSEIFIVWFYHINNQKDV